MKSTLRALIFTALIFTALIGIAISAQAAILPGVAGVEQIGNAFSQYQFCDIQYGLTGAIANTCTDSEASVVYSLRVDNTGSKSVTVKAWGAYAVTDVQCFTGKMTNNGVMTWGNWTNMDAFGGANVHTITLPKVTVDSGDSLFVECNLAPGNSTSRVYSVSYNP